MNFDQRPCTIVQGLWPNFGATLKIHKKSNFDRNQLKLSTQHKYMYMYQKMSLSILTILVYYCQLQSINNILFIIPNECVLN